jgi:hypothetical protein
MTTKLKIDLLQGILEVEGSEVFVRAIYSDFKAYFGGEEPGAELPQLAEKRRRTRRSKRSEIQAQPAQRPVVTEQPAADGARPVEVKPEPEAPLPAPVDPAPKASPKPEYTFLETLDLSSADGRPSLVGFMDAKFPITNDERNLVFLYYLQYTLKIKEITIDHIYTCYRAAKIRAPFNIDHSLQTTARQHRWVKIDKNGHLSLTSSGKLYVEKQLPKTTKSK